MARSIASTMATRTSLLWTPLVCLAVAATAVLGAWTVRDRVAVYTLQTKAAAKDHEGRAAESLAVGVARQLDRALLENFTAAMHLANDPTLAAAAESARAQFAQAGLDELEIEELENRAGLDRMIVDDPATRRTLTSTVAARRAFAEAFITDAEGLTVAASHPTSDFVQSDEDWWQHAYRAGTYIGPVEYDSSARTWSLDVVSTFGGAGRHLAGILKVVVSIAAAEAIAEDAAGEDTRVSVLTGEGLLIAETASGHAESRVMSEAVNLRESSADDAFGAERRGHRLHEDRVLGWARTATGKFYEGVAPGYRGLDWVVLVDRSRPAVPDLEDDDLVWLWLAGLIAILVCVTGTGVAPWLARGAARRARDLAAATRDVVEGRRSEPVVLDGDDELSAIASDFERVRKAWLHAHAGAVTTNPD